MKTNAKMKKTSWWPPSFMFICNNGHKRMWRSHIWLCRNWIAVAR